MLGPSDQVRAELGVSRDETLGPDSEDWMGVPMVDEGVVPPGAAAAVVTEEMFKTDLTPVELTPEAEQLWLDAWTEIKAGA